MLKDINYLDNKEEFISKITRCEVLDTEDWTVFDDIQGKDFFALYEKYKELVCFQNIVYQDVECDTL